LALRSKIYRAELSVADMDRAHYATQGLTLARHPSETEERLMVRLLAYALHADARLAFGAGLSTDDEPDLWLKDDTGAIELWIDVGLPEEREVRRACGRSRRVAVLSYGGRKAAMWWSQNASELARCPNLEVLAISETESAALAQLAARSMQLTCTIQDGHVWIGNAVQIVPIELQRWKSASQD
jgi:uncharacterized protein YaeQ